MQEIEAAYFTNYLWGLFNQPLEEQGELHVEHVIFDSILDGYDADPRADLGVL